MLLLVSLPYVGQVSTNCRVNTTNIVVFTTSLHIQQAGILRGMNSTRTTSSTDPVPATTVALGKRIKQCRHAAEKSQEALAFDAKVDRTYISGIERGVANPSIETLADICHALGISLSELFAPFTSVPRAPTGERRANAAEPPGVKRTRLR